MLKFLVLGLILSLFGGPAFAASTKILVFGDSLVSGYGLRDSDAFPVVLGQRLQSDGYDVVIANAGVPGNTTAMGLARSAQAADSRPDLVILELGINDLLNDVPLHKTRNNLVRLIRRFKAAGARVILAGMIADDRRGAAYKRAFDALYPSLAAKYALPLYPNFLEGVANDPAYTQQGGLHPNADGVRAIVIRLAPLVEETLDSMGARAQKAAH
jgi:acyl-CoA thioesterase-1